jgi:hypothetical protein
LIYCAENSRVFACLSYLNRLIIDRGLRYLKENEKLLEKGIRLNICEIYNYMQVERSSKKKHENNE